MKNVLENLALIDLNNFCQKNKINIEGTHLVKNGRGYKYSLVKNENDKALVTVSFSKSSTPIHYIHE